MVRVKRVLSCILVLTISILIGCSKVKDDNAASLDLFDVFKGKELAANYLIILEMVIWKRLMSYV